MEKNAALYISVAVLLVLAIGGMVAYNNRPGRPGDDSAPTNIPTPPNKPGKDKTVLTHPELQQTEHDVIYNSHGFFPAITSLKKGDIVKFINQTGGDLHIASNPHPTHTDYPGTDSSKCGTPDAAAMFDSCKNIKMGDSWIFEFDQVGTWGYHNHARPKDMAKIVVTK